MDTQSARGFHLVARPPSITSSFTHVVVDAQAMPHLMLTAFFHDLQQAHGDGTARAYLHILLPYFTYLQMDPWCQERGTHWNQPPEAVQVVVEAYLREQLGCKIRGHATYATVKMTVQSPSTIKLFLAALKRFYTYARRVRAYPYEHPLIDHAARLFAEIQREREQLLQGHPIRPSVSGVAPPRRFPPENYFRMKREEWIPQTIDDPTLLKRLLKAAREVNCCLRDRLVIHLAAETGARISEILHLTLGDWRAYGGRTQAKTCNKGSHGQRTKSIRFTKETARLLQRYLNTERARLDPQQRQMNQLADTDPIFLSERRRPYSYAAFYPHWRQVCQTAQIRLTIHGLRHWHVTESVRFIYSQKGQTAIELALARERLIRYMRWKSSKTIEAYEHFVKDAEHAPVLTQIQQEMYAHDVRYVREQESKRRSRLTARQLRQTTTPVGTGPSPKAAGRGWDDLLALGRKPDG